MHHQSQGSRGPRRTSAWLCWVLLLAGLMTVPTSPAQAASTYHCSGYAGCKKAGYPHYGYKKRSSTMYWRMYGGHNCTNYVAYRLVKSGMPNTRPWSGSGNATNWGVAMRKITDSTPRVGAVAWWKANTPGAGSSGHVAMVEKVISADKIVISEDSWGGTFHWRTLTKGRGWPSGFIHFNDKVVVNTAAPTMSAAPRAGVAVGARAGGWTPAANYSYQWLANGVPISGATGGNYTPTPAQVGARLAVRVTASRSGFTSATATSAPMTVAPGGLTPTGVPSVTGEPYAGEKLVANYAGWRPAEQSRTVQWYADGVPIAGETRKRLPLTEALLGKTITIRITGTAAGYAPSTVESVPVGPVYLGDVEVTEPPSLRGETRPGATLAVDPPTAAPTDARASYTWLRDGAPIAGATGATYRLGPDDLGRRVAVQVSVARPGYRSHVQTLATPGRVSTSSKTRIRRTVGGHGTAAVVVRVRVRGQASPNGRVRVRSGGKSVIRRVRDGKRTIVVEGVRPGRRKVKAVYLGNSLVTRSRDVAVVQVGGR